MVFISRIFDILNQVLNQKCVKENIIFVVNYKVWDNVSFMKYNILYFNTTYFHSNKLRTEQ